LVFLKFASDKFEERRAQLIAEAIGQYKASQSERDRKHSGVLLFDKF
jgi:hypothetical protein